jgi:hypothetical protein
LANPNPSFPRKRESSPANNFWIPALRFAPAGMTIWGEFLATQQRRLLDEIASLRDDIKVLTAIVLRNEETLIRMLEQMTAMVAQNARVVVDPGLFIAVSPL